MPPGPGAHTGGHTGRQQRHVLFVGAHSMGISLACPNSGSSDRQSREGALRFRARSNMMIVDKRRPDMRFIRTLMVVNELLFLGIAIAQNSSAQTRIDPLEALRHE